MDNKTLTGLSRKQITIPAYTTKTIDYNDTKPNYFRVQNTGDTPIYCGTSHIPTAKNYDFMCNAKAMKMYAEPFHRTTIYIFNPSASDIVVTVLSFSAEFDPIALTLSDITIDLPTSDLGISSVISSFETALPKGYNHIGEVTVSNMGDMVMFDVAMQQVAENTSYIHSVYDFLAGRKKATCDAKTITTDEDGITPANGFISKIDFFSNDCSQPLDLNIIQGNSTTTITVKPNEVLNNVKCWASSITVIGDGLKAVNARLVVEIDRSIG